MSNNNNAMIVQHTYPVPPNIPPMYFIGAFGSICTSMGVEHHMPANSSLADLPTMLVGESVGDVNRMVSELLIDLQIWAATFTNISCTGSIIGGSLHLYFSLSGKQDPYVNISQ